MKIAWGNRVSTRFLDRSIKVCRELGWEPREMINPLMGCMAFESGESFSSTVKNAMGSGAVGLIQFMPATARDLGTSTEALMKMDNVQQLDWVQKYFRPYRSKIRGIDDLYMAILLPKFIGMPGNSTLFMGPGKSYQQNSVLDKTGKGYVTKDDACVLVRKKMEKGLLEGNSLEWALEG